MFINIAMVKIGIDNFTTHLPLKKARGTVEQRLQKAIQMNDCFYDRIKDKIQKKDITGLMYERQLKKVTGVPSLIIKITEFIPLFEKSRKSSTVMRIDAADLKQHGHIMALPYDAYTQRISGRSVNTFMHENLHLLEKLVNPKYNARTKIMINKGYDIAAVDKFFNENLYTKSTLKPESLTSFLSGKSISEKIDTLQYLRYQLMQEKHAHEYVDANLEKFKELYAKDCHIEFSKTSGKYEFDKKIKILEKELAFLLETEREINSKLVL